MGKYSFRGLCQFEKPLCQIELDKLYRLISNSTILDAVATVYLSKMLKNWFWIMYHGKYSFRDLCQLEKQLCQIELDEFYRMDYLFFQIDPN